MKTFFGFFLTIAQSLFGAFIFVYMWNWFVVRAFPSLPQLTFMNTVGLLITADFLLLSLKFENMKKELREKYSNLDNSSIDIVTSLVMIILIYPILFSITYIWHLMMR
jgi:hypothetical protein